MTDEQIAQHLQGTLHYHAVYDSTIASAIRWAKAAGFRGVQLAVEAPHLCVHTLAEDEPARLAALLRRDGMALSVHAHDRAVNLFETHPALVEGMHAYLESILAFCRATGARALTIHLQDPTDFPTEDRSRRWPEIDTGLHRRALEENLGRLLEAAGTHVQVCLENTSNDAWARDLCQEYINQGRLRLCWDLAKTYRPDGRPREELAQWFLRNIHRIEQVHLHDLAEGKGHRAIGSGCVDFRRWLAPLVEADVRRFVVEVRPNAQAAESREALLAMFHAPGAEAKAPSTKRGRPKR